MIGTVCESSVNVTPPAMELYALHYIGSDKRISIAAVKYVRFCCASFHNHQTTYYANWIMMIMNNSARTHHTFARLELILSVFFPDREGRTPSGKPTLEAAARRKLIVCIELPIDNDNRAAALWLQLISIQVWFLYLQNISTSMSNGINICFGVRYKSERVCVCSYL